MNAKATTFLAKHLPLVSEEVGQERYAAMVAERGQWKLRDSVEAVGEAMEAALGDETLGCGFYRVTWQHAGYVYKIPHGDYSAQDACDQNIYEATQASDDYAGIPIAPCTLVWHESGVPICIMEAVDPNAKGERPAWAKDVDCQQVGKTSRGKWVVYDAGYPLSGEDSSEVREADTPTCFAA